MFSSFNKKVDPSKAMTVIVRGVGERTETVCSDLLSAEMNGIDLHLIHETPFSAALKKSYEIGLNANRKWTLVIDADVLIRSDIIKDLYVRAESAPESVFVLQTEMLDKFFGGKRVGGIKVYRTALLKKALTIVPTVDNRPEAYTIKHMHKAGFYVDITDLNCGVHDFEQYYSDIFRKGFAYGMKHQSFVDTLMPYWRRQANEDEDFVVLLAGFNVAKKHTESLKLAHDEVQAEFEKFMKSSGFAEKNPIAEHAINRDWVDNMIRSFASPPEYETVKLLIDKMGRPTVPTDA